MLNFYRACRPVIFLFLVFLAEVKTSVAYGDTKEQLIFISDFIRHGARTPIVYLDAKNIQYPLAWKDITAGELTGQGLSGEKRLGNSFRKTYVEDSHFLPADYDARKMCIRSSSVNRTVMSATAALLGLYPLDSTSGYSLKIDKVPTKQDLLLSPAESNPMQFLKLLNSYVLKTPDWESKFAVIEKNFKRWSEITGYTVTDFNSLSTLTDNVKALFAYCQQNKQCTAKLTHLTASDIATLLQWQDWSLSYIFSVPQIAEFMACNPLSEVAYNLHKVAEGYHFFSYILYSAHDINLLGLLSYLGHPLDHQPTFGANLRFSLYKIGKKDFEVRVEYFEQGKTEITSIYKGSLNDFYDRYYKEACFQAIKNIGQCNLYRKRFLSDFWQ